MVCSQKQGLASSLGDQEGGDRVWMDGWTDPMDILPLGGAVARGGWSPCALGRQTVKGTENLNQIHIRVPLVIRKEILRKPFIFLISLLTHTMEYQYTESYEQERIYFQIKEYFVFSHVSKKVPGL